MKSRTAQTSKIVENLLDNPHVQRMRKWAKIEVYDAKTGAEIYVFLIDKKGHIMDYFYMQTNEDGYVHPGQVISLIIDAFQVATERMKYRYMYLEHKGFI